MRPAVLALILISCVSVPEVGKAQVFRNENLPPAVTAAGAPWQVNGEPLFYAGAFYDPAGTTEFFDGKVMVRTGVYEGVPLYEDATRQPYSVVLVPVGGAVMRPYVRRTIDDGMRVGTGGRVLDVARDVLGDTVRLERAGVEYALVPVGTLGRLGFSQQPTTVDQEFRAVSVVAASPQPAANGSGVWIEFDGTRWFSVGRAVDYDANRFEPAGTYRGYPVFRERGGAGNRIFVTVVHDGPLAPFERR